MGEIAAFAGIRPAQKRKPNDINYIVEIIGLLLVGAIGFEPTTPTPPV
jgi:hypothetical protein